MTALVRTRLIQQWGYWYIETPVPRRTAGIYAVENVVTGRAYVGSSVDIYQRWIVHTAELKRGGYRGLLIQNDWDLHGPTSISLAVLEEILDPSSITLEAAEQKWMDRIRAKGLLYNVRLKAGRGDWHTDFKSRARRARRASPQPAEPEEQP